MEDSLAGTTIRVLIKEVEDRHFYFLVNGYGMDKREPPYLLHSTQRWYVSTVTVYHLTV